MSNIAEAPLPATTPTEPVSIFRLTSNDRCDACGAQAYIEATVNKTPMLYCGHHARKYEAKLRAASTSWLDESARLLEDQSRAGGDHH